MGFDVAGYSRGAKRVDGFSVFAGHDLDAFLARTDILVSLLPLTPKTRGILNRALFRSCATVPSGDRCSSMRAVADCRSRPTSWPASTMERSRPRRSMCSKPSRFPDDSALWSHPR